jgi:hypothetical protein
MIKNMKLDNIKLFHGSTVNIEKPEILTSSRCLDFGTGFYTARWAKIKRRRKMTKDAIVSSYIFDAGDKELLFKTFEGATEEWLEFIMSHRSGNEIGEFDVVCGPVANDTLYETLSLYERGILNHAETIVRLKTHKLADQVVFRTVKALSFLKYDGDITV